MESWCDERTMNIFSMQFFRYYQVYLNLSFLLLDRNRLRMDDENYESIDEGFKILQTKARAYHLKIESVDLVKRKLVINISWNATTIKQQRNGHQKIRTV